MILGFLWHIQSFWNFLDLLKVKMDCWFSLLSWVVHAMIWITAIKVKGHILVCLTLFCLHHLFHTCMMYLVLIYNVETNKNEEKPWNEVCPNVLTDTSFLYHSICYMGFHPTGMLVCRCKIIFIWDQNMCLSKSYIKKRFHYINVLPSQYFAVKEIINLHCGHEWVLNILEKYL